jgi:hypothetical protein
MATLKVLLCWGLADTARKDAEAEVELHGMMRPEDVPIGFRFEHEGMQWRVAHTAGGNGDAAVRVCVPVRPRSA